MDIDWESDERDWKLILPSVFLAFLSISFPLITILVRGEVA